MNETEKNAAKEVASRLLILSADLLDDKFISTHDLAGTLNRLANRLMADIHKGDTPSNSDAERLKIFRLRDMMSMPRDIEMKEFVYADGSITFIGQYVNERGVAPHDKPKRVYSISLVRHRDSTYTPSGEHCCAGQWAAYIFEDQARLATVEGGRSKWSLAYAALGALRGILYQRCVSTNGNRRRRRKESMAAKNPVNPVNPVSKNKEA